MPTTPISDSVPSESSPLRQIAGRGRERLRTKTRKPSRKCSTKQRARISCNKKEEDLYDASNSSSFRSCSHSRCRCRCMKTGDDYSSRLSEMDKDIHISTHANYKESRDGKKYRSSFSDSNTSSSDLQDATTISEVENMPPGKMSDDVLVFPVKAFVVDETAKEDLGDHPQEPLSSDDTSNRGLEKKDHGNRCSRPKLSDVIQLSAEVIFAQEDSKATIPELSTKKGGPGYHQSFRPIMDVVMQQSSLATTYSKESLVEPRKGVLMQAKKASKSSSNNNNKLTPQKKPNAFLYGNQMHGLKQHKSALSVLLNSDDSIDVSGNQNRCVEVSKSLQHYDTDLVFDVANERMDSDSSISELSSSSPRCKNSKRFTSHYSLQKKLKKNHIASSKMFEYQDTLLAQLSLSSPIKKSNLKETSSEYGGMPCTTKMLLKQEMRLFCSGNKKFFEETILENSLLNDSTSLGPKSINTMSVVVIKPSKNTLDHNLFDHNTASDMMSVVIIDDWCQS